MRRRDQLDISENRVARVSFSYRLKRYTFDPRRGKFQNPGSLGGNWKQGIHSEIWIPGSESELYLRVSIVNFTDRKTLCRVSRCYGLVIFTFDTRNSTFHMTSQTSRLLSGSQTLPSSPGFQHFFTSQISHLNSLHFNYPALTFFINSATRTSFTNPEVGFDTCFSVNKLRCWHAISLTFDRLRYIFGYYIPDYHIILTY